MALTRNLIRQPPLTAAVCPILASLSYAAARGGQLLDARWAISPSDGMNAYDRREGTRRGQRAIADGMRHICARHALTDRLRICSSTSHLAPARLYLLVTTARRAHTRRLKTGASCRYEDTRLLHRGAWAAVPAPRAIPRACAHQSLIDQLKNNVLMTKKTSTAAIFCAPSARPLAFFCYFKRRAVTKRRSSADFFVRFLKVDLFLHEFSICRR